MLFWSSLRALIFTVTTALAIYTALLWRSTSETVNLARNDLIRLIGRKSELKHLWLSKTPEAGRKISVSLVIVNSGVGTPVDPTDTNFPSCFRSFTEPQMLYSDFRPMSRIKFVPRKIYGFT